jgi:hypothetical protein
MTDKHNISTKLSKQKQIAKQETRPTIIEENKHSGVKKTKPPIITVKETKPQIVEEKNQIVTVKETKPPVVTVKETIPPVVEEENQVVTDKEIKPSVVTVKEIKPPAVTVKETIPSVVTVKETIQSVVTIKETIPPVVEEENQVVTVKETIPPVVTVKETIQPVVKEENKVVTVKETIHPVVKEENKVVTVKETIPLVFEEENPVVKETNNSFTNNKIDNFFKDLPKLKIVDSPNIQNKFIQDIYNKFINKIRDDLKKIVDNSNKINVYNTHIAEYILNIERDIDALQELHKNLLKDNLNKQNSHYVDSIYFQQIMIASDLSTNIEYKNKYLNKFYYDLYGILTGIHIKIPQNIKKYDMLSNIIVYTYNDIFNVLKFLLETSIKMTNDITGEFDFIICMEEKENQGFNLTEFNTNLNYKITNKMNEINYIFDKIKYIINFQLIFSKKFKNKMNSIANEVDIKYH